MSASRRVLHVCAYYPPRVGGVGEVVAHLHQLCLKEGFGSTVITGGKQSRQPDVRRYSRWSLLLFRLAAIATETRQVDIVHCHGGEVFLLPLAMKILRIRTPVLATFHVDHRQLVRSSAPYKIDGHRFQMSLRGSLGLALKGICHRFGQWIMVKCATECSFVAQSTARQFGFTGASAMVIHNGVDVPRSADSSWGAEPADLLFVGVDAFRKHVYELPFILKRVHEQLPNTSLRIVGMDAPRNSRLHRLIQELGLVEHILIEGRCDQSRVRELYRGSRALLMPSVYEGLPMVFLEAGARGLPVIASNVCGHPEVIDDGVSGYLVTPGDIGTYADRCVTLLRDEPLRRSMGEALQRRVRRDFDRTVCAQKYFDQYKSMWVP